MESNAALSMAFGTGPIVKIILLILACASVMSWTIIFAKLFVFRKAEKESEKFLDLFWNSRSLDAVYSETKHLQTTPIAGVFRAGYLEFQKLNAKGQEGGGANLSSIMNQGLENVQRALRKAFLNENLRLEKLVPYLATIAAVSPFIGLFGTVWGIMGSFQGLGQGGPATLQRVAPGISEALIATAVGLAAAIPAVIAYNQYIGKMKRFRSEMESFTADFTNILKRNYIS